MGSGEELAHQVADITLKNDDLALVKQGIQIGQTLQSNLAKIV